MGLMCVARAASAQVGVRIDQLPIAAPDSAFFRVEGLPGPAPADGLGLAMALGVEYARDPLTLRAVDAAGGSTDLSKLVRDAVITRVAAAITPTPWLAFDASLPIAVSLQGDRGGARGYGSAEAGSAPGAGDFRVGAHLKPSLADGLALIVGGRFWAPIGARETYLSDTRFRAEIDLGVAGESAGALFGCTASVAPGLFMRRAGDRAGIACALHAKLGSVVSIGIEPSAAVITDQMGLVEGHDRFVAQVEPLAALRVRAGAFRLGVAGGPGFGAAPGAATARALFSIGFVGSGAAPKAVRPPPPDADLDGIPDATDACPHEAGVPSSSPARNGCLMHDRDGDGVADEQDACPDRAGVRHSNAKANGCPDSDNDGLPDPIDICRIEPSTQKDGCPLYARLRGSHFDVSPPLEFTPGLDHLTERSRAAIDEIAATLRANRAIEKLTVVLGIKGAVGPLNDKRAKVILDRFRADDVDPSRYEVVLKDDVRAGEIIVRISK